MDSATQTRTIIGVIILGLSFFILVILVVVSVVRKKYNIAPGPLPAIELLIPNKKRKTRREGVFLEEELPWEENGKNRTGSSQKTFERVMRDGMGDDAEITDFPVMSKPVHNRRNDDFDTKHKQKYHKDEYDDYFEDDIDEVYPYSRPSIYSPNIYDFPDDVWDAQVEFEYEYARHGEDEIEDVSHMETGSLSPRASSLSNKLSEKIEKMQDKLHDGLESVRNKMKKHKSVDILGSIRKKKKPNTESIIRPVIRRTDSAKIEEQVSQNVEHMASIPRSLSTSNLSQRRKILLEFLHTEQTYVFGITTLVEFFVTPLETNPSQYGTSEKFVNEVFSEIKNILTVNESFMKQLEKIIPDNDDDNTAERALSEEVIKWCGAFKLYVKYIGTYQSIMKKIAREKKKHAKLDEFIKKQVEMLKAERNIGQLSSLMITPVQRIPRYRLLLESLIKLDEESRSEEDLLRLHVALDSITEVAEYCNEKERELESMNKMFELSQKLHKKDLIKPDRILILESENVEYEQSNSKVGHCNIFLFNDIFVIQKKSSVKRPREILIDADVLVLEGNDDKEFKISKKELIGHQKGEKIVVNVNAPRSKGDYIMKFILNSPQECKHWMDQITKAVQSVSQKDEHKIDVN